MKRVVIVLILVVVAGLAWGQGVKKKKVLPPEYGRVVMASFAPQSGVPPVVFDHWQHRRNYTCRLCHVDIGFAMTAGGTKVRAADNMKGYYCGTCHNGSTKFNGKKIFPSCGNEPSAQQQKQCERCHYLGTGADGDCKFDGFAGKMPKEMYGNGINWERAEQEGLLKLVDHIEGVSVPKPKMKVQQDFALKSKVEGMPDIIFSHTKHTFWSGCELCHPEIFMGIKRGATKYSMVEIFEGKYCGVCHGKVAFPLTDCQRCHAKPIGG